MAFVETPAVRIADVYASATRFDGRARHDEVQVCPLCRCGRKLDTVRTRLRRSHQSLALSYTSRGGPARYDELAGPRGSAQDGAARAGVAAERVRYTCEC